MPRFTLALTKVGARDTAFVYMEIASCHLEISGIRQTGLDQGLARMQGGWCQAGANPFNYALFFTLRIRHSISFSLSHLSLSLSLSLSTFSFFFSSHWHSLPSPRPSIHPSVHDCVQTLSFFRQCPNSLILSTVSKLSHSFQHAS